MVNAPVRIKNLPAKAIDIQSLLDIVLQVVNVISSILNLFGIRFGA